MTAWATQAARHAPIFVVPRRERANEPLAGLVQDPRMQLEDRSEAVFGRRGKGIAPPVARETTRRQGHRVQTGRVAYMAALLSLFLIAVGFFVWTAMDIAKLNGDSSQVTQRVIEIVNQPITHLARSGPAGLFSPGWFDPGASKPDFNNVDIRTTQQFIYDGYGYVSSDLNPTEMFIGSELEFNAMTKYFYIDRSLPKKRLSEAEMLEINGLYRVIGKDEQALFMRWCGCWQAVEVVAGLCLALALLLPVGMDPQVSLD